MAWRIVGGMVGWLASLTPLVIVNIPVIAAAMDPSMVPLAGGAALALGIALGGALAGLLGGRRGSGWGGTLAGALASVLFAATLIALGHYLDTQSQLPNLIHLHPVRAMVAVGFVACLIMVVAAASGAVSGRRRERLAVNAMRQAARGAAPSAAGRESQPRASRAPSQPNAPYGANGAYEALDQRDRPVRSGQRPPSQPVSRSRSESHSRERAPRW
ncbi:MAG TPA: hypothetical protein VFN78_11905 [Ktedonobacterales bacterium]|nr:hypothetical protein [Ktedonobacterales bacterium]